MKYLKLFEAYQSESEVAEICEKYGITDWKLNSNGLVDVDGDIDLPKKGLTELPLKFGEVTGCFDCSNNKLTSLEGAPYSVGGFFDCCDNKLTSLEFAPKSVGDSFWCSSNGFQVGNYNNIRSFEGLVHISGDFYCKGNPIFNIWEMINNKLTNFQGGHKWDSEKIEFFNDCSIIQDDGESIAIDRFNFFLEEMGLDMVESVEDYKSIY
jgi:hypothetical protein